MKRSFPVSDFYMEDHRPPSTPSEALQRAGPHDVEQSTMETHSELDGAIESALSSFTELERDMIVMRFVEGLSVRQIAELTGISKTVVHRILPKLKNQVAVALRQQVSAGSMPDERSE